MTRRTLAALLLLALATTSSGLGKVCPGLDGAARPGSEGSGSAVSTAPAAVETEAEAALPPCHRKLAGAPSEAAGAEAAHPAPAAPHPGSEGKGCCDPASGMTCPHACHFLAVPRTEASLAPRSVLAPLGEAPAAPAPAPLPRGVDHIPLA